MEEANNDSILPHSLWGLDPLFYARVKLNVLDIMQLKNYQGYTGEILNNNAHFSHTQTPCVKFPNNTYILGPYILLATQTTVDIRLNKILHSCEPVIHNILYSSSRIQSWLILNKINYILS